MSEIDDSGALFSSSGRSAENGRGIPVRYILLAVVAVFVVTSVREGS